MKVFDVTIIVRVRAEDEEDAIGRATAALGDTSPFDDYNTASVALAPPEYQPKDD